jgi:hypothetical protein
MLACIGLGVGQLRAYFVGPLMRTMLFGVGEMDISAFGGGDSSLCRPSSKHAAPAYTACCTTTCSYSWPEAGGKRTHSV